MATKSLYGIMSLSVTDEDGNVLLDDVILSDMDLDYDPNPSLSIVVSGDVGGD